MPASPRPVLPRLRPLFADGLALDWLLAAGAPPRPLPELPPEGLQGPQPLPWWAAGSYAGDLRRRLLQLRQRPGIRGLQLLIPGLTQALRTGPGAGGTPPLLVPVASWKRQANPLPQLLCRALAEQLGWPIAELLQRSRPVLGQHHLGRELRWANQAGAFRSAPAARGRRGPRPPVLVVDDILTTGATAVAAAQALHSAGWRTAGLACLARTPWKGSDLRSQSR